MDFGGQWVGPTQTHVLRVAKEFGLETYEQFDSGRTIARLSDRKIRSFTGTIPSISVPALLELHFLMLYINRMSRTVNVEDPSLTPNADELDGQTLETAILAKSYFPHCRCAHETSNVIRAG